MLKTSIPFYEVIFRNTVVIISEHYHNFHLLHHLAMNSVVTFYSLSQFLPLHWLRAVFVFCVGQILKKMFVKQMQLLSSSHLSIGLSFNYCELSNWFFSKVGFWNLQQYHSQGAIFGAYNRFYCNTFIWKRFKSKGNKKWASFDVRSLLFHQ